MLDYKVVSLVEDKLGEVQDQRERECYDKVPHTGGRF